MTSATSQAPTSISAATPDPERVYDWAFEHFVGLLGERIAQGRQVLSLSQYGTGAATRFAALFDNRPGPRLDWLLGWERSDFIKAVAEKRKAGYYVVLVTATDAGADTRFSAIFEERLASQATDFQLDIPEAEFRAEVDRRGANGWVPRGGTIYDRPGQPWRVAMVWERNPAGVGWNAFAGLDHAQFEDHFQQQYRVWGRPVFATGSTTGRRLVIYRDDQIGQIGTGFVLRPAQTGEEFDKERETLRAQGIYPVVLQGHGSGTGRRFCAVFQRSETPVARVVRRTGNGAAVAAIDDAVIAKMKSSHIRGAALAIVQGTRLVYARGYSWAEPDYPQVLPTTPFRLASVSKLPITLALYQAIAEGLLTLEMNLPAAIPLTNPNGSAPTNDAYVNGSVRQLLELGGRFERYQERYADVRAAFNGNFPVTYDQIARYMLTVPLRAVPNDRLDDYGYFLAGQIVRRLRNKSTVEAALADRLLTPLQITRLRVARSLLAHQKPDEARYHPRNLRLAPSIMTNNRPLVPAGYGDEHYETTEGSGGLSGAVVDVARILAAMNARPYSPLGRPAVEHLLSEAVRVGAGHGFDALSGTAGNRRGQKGGLFQTSQSGIWFEENGLSSVIVWNGVHTGNDLSHANGGDFGWYPRFDKVLDAAAKVNWGTTDLFPQYGMDPLPQTQEGWRWCRKCEGMHFGVAGNSVCPAGGAHDTFGSGPYRIMFNSAFPYGQNGWRYCTKCGGLHFGGAVKGACAAGGSHDSTNSLDYRLVANSPYKEQQNSWRYCKKCQGAFFGGRPTQGRCPAGGPHDGSGSFDYSISYDTQ
jgi:CubicO group peptidase (beta-lactamase class C family)